MNSNIPTANDIYDRLQALVADMRALDADKLESANLVPMIKAVQSVGAFAATIDAQIQLRAIGNNELIPGVLVKDAVTHRKWSDQETAEALAQETFGDAAFSRTLLSPAQIEKLGKEGKDFVAVASYKPEGQKKASY